MANQDTTPNTMPHSHHTTLRLPKSRQYPEGRLIDCVNFHLKSAITDMRLWQASCWKRHSANRKLQRKQVIWSLTLLQNSTPFPTRPVVVAGDLNAPASDPLHDLFRGHFTDSYQQSRHRMGKYMAPPHPIPTHRLYLHQPPAEAGSFT